jgi:hypothetical protein
MKTCEACINKGICKAKSMICIFPLDGIGLTESRMMELLAGECRLYKENDLYFNPCFEDVK